MIEYTINLKTAKFEINKMRAVELITRYMDGWGIDTLRDMHIFRAYIGPPPTYRCKKTGEIVDTEQRLVIWALRHPGRRGEIKRQPCIVCNGANYVRTVNGMYECPRCCGFATDPGWWYWRLLRPADPPNTLLRIPDQVNDESLLRAI